MAVKTQRQAGFTLIEVLFVCGLIGILSAMALPRLLMAKQAADASSAIGSLRTIANSEAGFAASCGSGFYSPDLVTLGTTPPGSRAPFVSPDLSGALSVVKSGYTIQLMGTPAPAAPASCNGFGAGVLSRAFKAGADPIVSSNFRFFATNADMTIYEDSLPLFPATPEQGVPPSGHPLE
jgi:prepilin-type N-terminal cleavage/methylation domain-containing protein